MEGNVLDLGPLALSFLEILAALLSCLGLYAAKLARDFLKEKTGIELTQQNIETVNKALEMGIQYGMAKVRPAVENRAKIDIENDIVYAAADYALKHVPNALESLGITPGQVCELVMARLEDKKPNDLIEVRPTSPVPPAVR